MTNAERLQAAIVRLIEDAAEREHMGKCKFCDANGIHRSTLGSPAQRLPVDTLARIAKACGVTIADIFKEAGL